MCRSNNLITYITSTVDSKGFCLPPLHLRTETDPNFQNCVRQCSLEYRTTDKGQKPSNPQTRVRSSRKLYSHLQSVPIQRSV
jgi:hypothetical protein